MYWLVLLALAADALATSFPGVGLGGLHARRLKRTNGRRTDGVCKPRTTAFPTSTSIVLLPTSLLPTSTTFAQASPTTTRQATPSAVPAPAPAPQGLAAKVLPLGLGTSTNSWTTVPNTGAKYYSLTDTGTTLRPTRILGGSLAAPVNAPDGREAIEVFFGAGSYAFASGVPGGISFYAYGPSDLSQANELTLGYSIYFEPGFDFAKGGKLPGLYGGTTDDDAAGCSGGRIAPECFSTRFMWREYGDAELYVYLPPDQANTALCSNAPIPGDNVCSTGYGTSLGRGSFKFQPGQWNTVAQRIKLNTPGKADGELQVWSNGKSIWKTGGVVFRGAGMDASRVRGLMVQCFFGGHTADWASRKDQRLWFADFSVAQLS
ncbi:hypothetical protein BDV93DRAFT_523887 [Ceratobasidium sp. AG-I]|nr:hypothetical protein BDV93DRAFT_523887 [Ceratobasidium sp. AG-I]